MLEEGTVCVASHRQRLHIRELIQLLSTVGVARGGRRERAVTHEHLNAALCPDA